MTVVDIDGVNKKLLAGALDTETAGEVGISRGMKEGMRRARREPNK